MLDAGSVYATLGGRFLPSGFVQFDRAMYQSRSAMESGEKRMRSSADRTASSLAAMGKVAKVAAGGALLGLGAIIVSSTKKAADFEQQLSSLGSVSGANARQMKQLRAAAMEAGSATKFSAMEAAVAQTELAKGGVSIENILKGGLAGALALAAAGEMDLGEAASTTANALNLFKMRGDEATTVADAMAYAANATTADVKDFAMALTQGGAAAKNAGLDFNETMVFLEALARAGVKGSDAGTSMKTALVQLANPTEKQAAAAKRLGLEFFDAAGSMKPLPAISAMLRRELGGLTDQQRLQAATTLAGTDGMRGLLALYGTAPGKLRELARGTQEQGTAAEVAARKQANLKGKVEQLGGAIETAQIAIGSEMLPLLTEWAEKGADAVTAWARSGAAADLGHDVAGALQTAVSVAGTFVHVGGQVVGVLTDIGGALDLGDAGNITAIITAFAAFKIAGVVAPMVVSLAGALGTVVAAARTAPTLAAFAADIGLMVNPITAVAAAAAVAAGAIVWLVNRKSDEERASEAAAAAERDHAAALRDVSAAEDDAAHTSIDAKQADLDHARAVERLNQLRREGKQGTLDWKQAVLDEQRTALAARDAHRAAARAMLDLDDASRRTTTGVQSGISARETEIEQLKKKAEQYRLMGDDDRYIETQQKILDLEKQNEAALREQTRSAERGNVARLNAFRLAQGEDRILRRNLAGVSLLTAALNGVPRRVQSRLAVADQGSLAKLGNLSLRLNMLGKTRVMAHILTTAPNARTAIQAMQAVIKGLPNRKIVDILTNGKTTKADVVAFKASLAGVPPRVVARILSSAADERGKVAALTRAIRGVPSGKNVRVVAQGAAGEKQKVDALAQSIDSLHSKTITITTNEVHNISTNVRRTRAQGKRAGVGEEAIVGEGSRWQGAREAIVDRRTGTGFVVNRPTAVNLSDDHYVIPLDEYRGRALGLFGMLASDLGVERYAGGKPPRAAAAGNRRGGGGRRRDGDRRRRAPRKVPAKIAEGGVPFEDVKQRHEQADEALKRAREAEHSTKSDLNKAQKELKDARSKEERQSAQQRLDELKRQLHRNQNTVADRRRAAARRRRDFLAARETDNKVKNLQTETNVARDAMDDADRIDDQAAFDAARRKRTTKLGALIRLLQRAMHLATPDTDYYRSLKEQLSQLGGTAAVEGRADGFGGELGEAEAAEMDVEEPPPPPDPETFTEAERKRLSEIEAGIALAALTTGTDDDRARVQEKVDFLRGVLASALADPAPRGGNDAITELATSLKGAEDNLAAIASGSGTNDNADLQAQLEQERAGRQDALEKARIADAAVAAFSSTGDIGAGGPNAAYSASNPGGLAPQIVINTLHPADPATLNAIGSAATAGMAYQGLRQASREKVGV